LRKELTVLLEDSEDLSTSQESDLGNTVKISQGDTDLRRRKTLLGELDNQFNNSRGRESDPLGGSSSERESAGADTFSARMHTTHFSEMACLDLRLSNFYFTEICNCG